MFLVSLCISVVRASERGDVTVAPVCPSRSLRLAWKSSAFQRKAQAAILVLSAPSRAQKAKQTLPLETN